jgi:NTP pyrophosphatase (non-canonical NTP hydrolase)
MNNYQIQALQTLSSETTLYENAQHAGFGLMTEVGEILDTYKRHQFYKTELDTKNLIEETGDVLWYISLGYHSMGKEMPASAPVPSSKIYCIATPISLNKLLAKLAHHAANFFSVTMMYPDTWEDEQLEYDLDSIYWYLTQYLGQELKVTVEDAAEVNIEKLSKRYPNHIFSIERALNRDTGHELSHISHQVNGEIS